MGDLERRVERQEERVGIRGRREPSEAVEKQRWLARARLRRHDTKSREEFHALDVFRLLRRQGRLPETTEDLRDAILAWRPPIDPGAVERVIARVIYQEEPGTERMVCPPEQRAALVAADELLRRFEAQPDVVLARVLLGEVESVPGIPEELERMAVGPDFDEITDEERKRRLAEIVAPVMLGERGYRVAKHTQRLRRVTGELDG